METFTLDPRCWRIGIIVGRNRLIRRADRIEALVTLIALVVSLVAIPAVAVAGAMTFGARDHLYAQEAREQHAVLATVTGSGSDGRGPAVVQARWPIATGERTGRLELTNAAKAGDSIKIWVDKDGNLVVPPTPAWQALGDAVVTMMSALLLVGVGTAALVFGMRSRLDRVRDAQWEREIRCLEDDGGRTTQY